jgi:serine protease Do
MLRRPLRQISSEPAQAGRGGIGEMKEMKKYKWLSGVLLFVSGTVIGLLIAARLDFVGSGNAEQKPPSAAYPAVAESDVQQAFERVAEKVKPAVVSITTVETTVFRRTPFGSGDDLFDQFFRDFFGDMPERRGFKQQRMGLGSGFIIDEEGYILTNYHVVEHADNNKVTVKLPNGKELPGEVKGYDSRSDLAVVKVKAKNLPVATLGDSDTVRVGQWAIAFGNPFGFVFHDPDPTMTHGIVSALHRSLPRMPGTEDRYYGDLIQTDASINQGNSGGPLVDIKGNVIGINVAIVSPTGGSVGMGFAVPINKAKYVLGSLIKGKKVVYGWLGVQIQNLTEELAKYHGIPDTDGVLIYEVLKNTPADKAGLRAGDVVRSYDGENVRNVDNLMERVGHSEPGKRVKVGIIRDGKPQSVEIEIAIKPESEELAAEGGGRWRGLTVEELTPDKAEEFGIREKSGVVVTAIESGSPASESKVRVGDIITEINHRTVTNMKDFEEATRGTRGDALVRTNKGYIVIREKTEEE